MPDHPSSSTVAPSPSTTRAHCCRQHEAGGVSPAVQAQTTNLGNFVHTLLSRYNALSVCEFMVTRPEQPWWMIDAANSNPGLCSYANDLRHNGQCLHDPPCHADSLRCMGCGSAFHFAFRGCSYVDAILESMRVVRITDERMLRVFFEYAQEPMYRRLRLRFRSTRPFISPAALARVARKANYLTTRSRSPPYLRDSRRCLTSLRRSRRQGQCTHVVSGNKHPYKDTDI